MRQLTADQQASFTSEVLTLATLLDLVLTDGTHVKLTNHDADVGAYRSTFGLNVDNISMQLGGGGQSASASVLPDRGEGGGLTVAQIESGIIDGCDCQVSLIDWSKTNATPYLLMTGYVSEAKYGNAGTLALTMLTPLNKSRVLCGNIMSQMCRADFGDPGCGIDIEPMIDTTTAAGPINDQAFLLADSEHAATNYYNNGSAYFLTGANAGLGYEILTIAPPDAHGNSTCLIKVPMLFDVAAGDQIKLIPGCDKVLTSGCRFWNNETNFQGEPYAFDPSKTLAAACDVDTTVGPI